MQGPAPGGRSHSDRARARGARTFTALLYRFFGSGLVRGEGLFHEHVTASLPCRAVPAARAGASGIVAVAPWCCFSGCCDVPGAVCGRPRGALGVVPAVRCGGAEEVPGTAVLNSAGTPGSCRCRAPRRAAGPGGGSFRTAPASTRLRGHRDERHLAHRGGGSRPGRAQHRRQGRRHARCRAPRRGTAPPAELQDSSATPRQVFVVSEMNGSWRHRGGGSRHRRTEHGGDAEITSVSCASAGNCAAGGGYRAGVPARSIRRSWSAEVNGPWQHRRRGPRHRRPEHRRDCRDQLGVVRLGGQLRRWRGPTPTALHQGRSWSFRRAGAGGSAKRGPPAPRPSNGRDAAIASASGALVGNCCAGGTNRPATAAGVRRHRDQRELAHRRGVPGTPRSTPAAAGDPLGVMCLGERLQRRRYIWTATSASRRSSITRPNRPRSA